MHALFSGGLPEDSALLSNSTRGTLQSTQGPCLSLPPFLSPAAAPSKCQHLFSIKRVIVSVKKKKKNCSATGRLWTHEKKLPPLLFVWLRAMAGENGSKASIAHDKPQAVKPVMKRLWIYATISHNCTEAFPSLLKNLLCWTISRRNYGALFSL